MAQAHLALRTNETPVGCVLVYKGRVIAKGMNATNVTRNGTRHAEYMAIGALLSYTPQNDSEVTEQAVRSSGRRGNAARKRAKAAREQGSWGDVNPEDGHLYPYGQKLHPSPRVNRSVISECVLYVTVEPCVMCASLLRQLGIRKVYFGAVNDKFGGTGGVFRIHMNADQYTTSTATTQGPQLLVGARPTLPQRPSSSALPVRQGTLATSGSSASAAPDTPEVPTEEVLLEGHGGNVESGYPVEGGWGRDEAVTLLRQFYVQENGRGKLCQSSPYLRCWYLPSADLLPQHRFLARKKGALLVLQP
jgi:tRNA-specific adenosine deaminase 2